MRPIPTFLLLVGIMAISRADTSPPQRILLVGDSLAVGMADEFRNLSTHDGMDGRVEAKVGSRIDQWVRWLPAHLAHHRPSVVFVCLGTNDMNNQDGVRRNPELVNIIVEEARRVRAKVVWIGPPDMPPGRLPYEKDVRDILRERAPNFYDSRGLTLTRSPDGIHMTPQAYRVWMDHVWDRYFGIDSPER